MRGNDINFRMINRSVYLFDSIRRNSIKRIWFKVGDSVPTQIRVRESCLVDELISKIKQKLSPTINANITLYCNDEPLRPSLTVRDLICRENFLNSDESPLVVKQWSKSILIASTDEDNQPTGDYMEISFKCDADIENFMRAKSNFFGFVKLSEPYLIRTNFEQLEDGERYALHSNSGASIHSLYRWQENESRAMEEEVCLTIKDALSKEFPGEFQDLPRKIINTSGRLIQEWDGVFFSDSTLFLVEAKHKMSLKYINNITERLNAFPTTISNSNQREYRNVSFNKIIGVACGTLFPQELQRYAENLGLLVCHPSGKRYKL